MISANYNSVGWICASNIGCGNLLRSRAYAYDGWNLILEQIAHAGGVTDVIEYFWGSDLSGSEQGAGGVGGLVALSINGDFYFPCYDQNGNVTEYVDESGSIAVQFAYDAFGNLLATENSQLATLLSLRFSTKYLDPETGFYYYGYRYYDPELGRWLTRDPIEEQGGLNLYGFCGNDAVNRGDGLGFFDLPNTWFSRFYQKYGKLLNGAVLKDVLILFAAQINVWEGDDPWITSFLSLYLFGDGTKSIHLTKSEVKSMSVSPELLDLALEYDGFLKNDRIIPETQSRFRFEVDKLGPGNLTLGHFDVFYQGTVKNCHFKGKYRIQDKFEFEWVDNWGEGVRSFPGEARLRLFTLLSSGLPFDISSEWIDHSQ